MRSFSSWLRPLISKPKKSGKGCRGQRWHKYSRTIRPFLERLEDRLCPSVLNYTVVAQTGANASTVNLPNSSTSAGTLTSLSLASINDSGNVAFLGTLGNYSEVVEGAFNANGSVNLSDLSNAAQSRNSTFPQIDDQNNVIAQDQLLTQSSLNSRIMTWQPDGTYGSRPDATGSLSNSTGTGNIVLHPAISPDGTQVAYQVENSGQLSLYINKQPVNTFPSGSGGLYEEIVLC